MTRRDWLASLGLLAAGRAWPQTSSAQADPQAEKKAPIPLTDFEPRSTLQVPQSRVTKARFPVIDVHSHLAWSAPDGSGPVTPLARPEYVLEVMDRHNVRAMVHLTGGFGKQLRQNVSEWQTAHPGRFYVFAEPMWTRAGEPGYSKLQVMELERAHHFGARGLKVLKTLGLFLRDGGPKGRLVKVDDPRFDPLWEACGALKMPVAIHVSDPVAFFQPIDRYNERYEELHNHPDWSFHGDFPSNAELLEARNRVFARHPKTQFLTLHVGNFAEDLGHVAASLDRFPNMTVEIGARIGELGRQPRTARKFFDKYQDRILFGTDAVPFGRETPQQIFGDELYEIYFRFLETEDEYFDYAPAKIPPQGRWRIYGLGLPESILKKVYWENAARLLSLKA